MGCSMSGVDSDPCKACNELTVIRNDDDDDYDSTNSRVKSLPELIADEPEEVFEDLVLTGSQSLVIRNSWIRLQTNLTSVGKQVFLKIFEFRPSVKRMFPFKDSWGDRLIRHPQFVEQARRFMQVIHCIVSGLDLPKSRSAERLVRLGRKHVTIEGFLPDYFDVFTRAIMSVLKQELKDDYTDEAAEAWSLLFAFIIDNLKIGYEAEFKLHFMNSTN